MQSAPLPKVDIERVRWWRSRLHQYRSLVVFSWNALTFHDPNWLPGVAVWLGINLAIIALFRMCSSIIQRAGEVLVISALLYILMHIGQKSLQVNLFPKWVPDYETRFQHITIRVTHAEALFWKGIDAAKKARKMTPWKFYCIGIVASLLLIELGRWLSTAFCVQLLASSLLLLPLVLEYHQGVVEYGVVTNKIQTQLQNFFKELHLRLRDVFNKLQHMQQQRKNQ